MNYGTNIKLKQGQQTKNTILPDHHPIIFSNTITVRNQIENNVCLKKCESLNYNTFLQIQSLSVAQILFHLCGINRQLFRSCLFHLLCLFHLFCNPLFMTTIIILRTLIRFSHSFSLTLGGCCDKESIMSPSLIGSSLLFQKQSYSVLSVG